MKKLMLVLIFLLSGRDVYSRLTFEDNSLRVMGPESRLSSRLQNRLEEENQSEKEFLYPQCVNEFKTGVFESLGLESDSNIFNYSERERGETLSLNNSCDIITNILANEEELKKLLGQTREISPSLLIYAIGDEKLHELTTKLKDCQKRVELQHCSIVPIIKLGHSLGGAHAQAFSTMVMKELHDSPNPRDKEIIKNLHTTTFGTFGGGPIIKMALNVTAEEELEFSKTDWDKNQTHYYVKGDMVPSLSSIPFGQARALPEEEGRSSNDILYSTIEAHRVDNFQQRCDQKKLSQSKPVWMKKESFLQSVSEQYWSGRQLVNAIFSP